MKTLVFLFITLLTTQASAQINTSVLNGEWMVIELNVTNDHDQSELDEYFKLQYKKVVFSNNTMTILNNENKVVDETKFEIVKENGSTYLQNPKNKKEKLELVLADNKLVIIGPNFKMRTVPYKVLKSNFVYYTEF